MEQELKAMGLCATKVINLKVVTRWSADRWEVGTFGRSLLTLPETLAALGV